MDYNLYLHSFSALTLLVSLQKVHPAYWQEFVSVYTRWNGTQLWLQVPYRCRPCCPIKKDCKSAMRVLLIVLKL